MIKKYSTFINERKINLNCADCKGKTEALFIKRDLQKGGTGDIYTYQPWWNSIQESYEHLDIDFEMSEDDIKELFIDFYDDAFKIDIKYTFGDINWNYNVEDHQIIVLSDTQYYPLIEIDITGSKLSKKDMSDNLHTIIDYLESSYNVFMYDNEGVLDRKYLSVKGGQFVYDDEMLLEYNTIKIYLILDKIVTLSQLQIAKYYHLKEYVTIGNEIYGDIEMSDLVDLLISRGSMYREYFEDDFDPTYDTYYYRPSVHMLFTDILTNDNKLKVIKILLENYKGDYLKENGLKLSDISENMEYVEELIDGSIYVDTIVDDIMNEYANYLLNEHTYRNKEEIISDFDKRLAKDFDFTKYHNSNENVIYRIKFHNNFIVNIQDDVNIFERSFHEILHEYCLDNIRNYNLEPHLSDFSDIKLDIKEFNDEISSLLK